MSQQCLPTPSIPSVFDLLDQEITWRGDITHRGGSFPRRFTLQADIIDDAIPRHTKPMEQLPKINQFTPTVAKIRDALETKFGCTSNHAILQQYRDGEDHINGHSDKTLDLEPGILIVNYSAGETRKITFRTKEKMGHGERDKHELFLEMTVLYLGIWRRIATTSMRSGGIGIREDWEVASVWRSDVSLTSLRRTKMGRWRRFGVVLRRRKETVGWFRRSCIRPGQMAESLRLGICGFWLIFPVALLDGVVSQCWNGL